MGFGPVSLEARRSGREPGAAWALREATSWLAATRLGLAVMALVVGGGAGLAAAGFRWLIYAFTWLATGHQQFGEQGHAASLHMPWLGLSFLVLIPVLGGLLYGPLIDRFAREAIGRAEPAFDPPVSPSFLLGNGSTS